MKWPKRTAQGFSPGLAAKAFDLKVSTEARYPGLQADYIAHLNDLISVKLNPNRSSFQGVPSKNPYPGLKPWVKVLARFAFIDHRLSRLTSNFSPLTYSE
jgi:hypothetical protein